MSPIFTRRAWLTTSSLFVWASFARSEGTATDTASIDLTPDRSLQDFRIRYEVALDGHIEIVRSQGSEGAKPHQVPLKAESKLDYFERVSRDDQHAVASRRRYHEAKSDGMIQRDALHITLRREASDIQARMVDGRCAYYHDGYLLTSQELELLRTPIVSFAVDRLLPEQPVAVGGTWKVSDEALVALMDLNLIDKSEVACRLASADDKVAKIELTGTLSGQVEGVATTMNVAAKLQFDRKQQAIIWFAMSLREQRSIGKAEPGFGITAQVKMARQVVSDQSMSTMEPPIDLTKPVPKDRLMVDLRGSAGFSFIADRDWRLLSDSPQLTVLRMIQRDKVIAQCEFRKLSPLKAGEQLTLEAYQADVRRALGKQFQDFIEAEEKLSESQVRVLRTTAQGTVNDIPVTWCYLHFSDDSGRRVSGVFTYETEKAEVFGAADAQIASSFQFFNIDESERPAGAATKAASAPASGSTQKK